MGWDKKLPIDAQPLRTLASVIRNNWDAIEEGDEVSGTDLVYRSLQFGNRTVIASAADPATVSTSHFLYTKEDDGAVQELYSKDAAGNITQLTNDGAIGGPGTKFQSEGGFSFSTNNFVWAYGRINISGGTIDGGEGLSGYTINGNGEFQITFSRTPDNANYMIWGTSAVGTSQVNPRVVEFMNLTNTTAGFTCRLKRADGTTVTTEDFYIAVIGGFA